jgi:hypothetical protein
MFSPQVPLGPHHLMPHLAAASEVYLLGWTRCVPPPHRILPLSPHPHLPLWNQDWMIVNHISSALYMHHHFHIVQWDIGSSGNGCKVAEIHAYHNLPTSTFNSEAPTCYSHKIFPWHILMVFQFMCSISVREHLPGSSDLPTDPKGCNVRAGSDSSLALYMEL